MKKYNTFNQEPKIEIKGTVASGKSALAWAIKMALLKYEIFVNIIGEDEVEGIMEESWEHRIKGLQNKNIEIETIQVNLRNRKDKN